MSKADQAQTANVIAKYSNQTLMLTITFEAEVKICNENLRAVNVTSPEGFFQPQSIRCVSKDGDSTKRCSGTVRTTIEKLICRSEITVNILPVYGREEETSYAIDGGTAEFTAMIEKETEWDGGKSVVGLRVDIDKQDMTVEWEDPFCPIEGLNSFNMKLTTGPLNSGNHLKLRIPTKCSRWQTRNRVLIVKGEKLMCLTGDNSEETSLGSDFKLLSCANYSLSVTPFALGEVSKGINFVSPFQSQGIR